MATGNGNGTVNMTPGVVLMDLDVRGWRANKALTPDDLGKTAAEIPEDFYLGHRALVPKKLLKKVRTLESRGRNVLQKYGYRFPIGETRAVPKGVLNEAEAGLKKIQDEFNEWRDNEFMPLYPDLRDAYITKNGSQFRSAFPSVEEVRDRFKFDWVVIEVTVPKGNDENAQKIRQRVETWVDEIAVEFRNAASTIFGTLSERIKNEQWGAVSDKRFSYLRQAIDRMRAINFLDDPAVEENLLRAKELLSVNSAESVRSDATVAQSVRDALNGIVGAISTANLDDVTGSYKRKLRI